MSLLRSAMHNWFMTVNQLPEEQRHTHQNHEERRTKMYIRLKLITGGVVLAASVTAVSAQSDAYQERMLRLQQERILQQREMMEQQRRDMQSLQRIEQQRRFEEQRELGRHQIECNITRRC
jgi:hypothetical protein